MVTPIHASPIQYRKWTWRFLSNFAQSRKLDVSPYFRRWLVGSTDAFRAACRSRQLKQFVSVRASMIISMPPAANSLAESPRSLLLILSRNSCISFHTEVKGKIALELRRRHDSTGSRTNDGLKTTRCCGVCRRHLLRISPCKSKVTQMGNR